jgi:recombination protein RecA
MSQALRKLSGAIKQSNAALVFTNQLREKIGVMFGNPETTSGGRALKFYASVRLDIRRIQSIKEKGELIGNRTRVRVTKNKVAPPFRKAEFDLMYDEGISRAGDLLDIAVDLGVMEKRGSYYYYDDPDNYLAQGRENTKEVLRESPEMTDEIEVKVRAMMGFGEEPDGGEGEYDEEAPERVVEDEEAEE